MATHGIPIDADELRRARIRARMTQTQLARAANCSPHHILRLETDRQNPSADLLDRLVAALRSDSFLTAESRELYVPAGVQQ